LRAVEQLLATRDADVRRLIAEYRTPNPRVESLIADARARGIEVQSANRARLQQLSGEVRHQGVVAEIRRSTQLDEAGLRTLVEVRLSRASGEPLLVLVLDGIQDPHNLGACLRTADAAGVDAIVVPKARSAKLSPAAQKAAAGAAETVPLIVVPNLARSLRWLSDAGVRLVGTDENGDVGLFDADLLPPIAIVLGAEGTGLRRLSREACDALIRIPMAGAVESLNVSVAAAVVLYEMLRQSRHSAPDS
jgi:23S rRNA (guanosine2251-2'-O)-methyltransferase